MNKSKILKFAGISMLGLGVVAVPTVMLVSCAEASNGYLLTVTTPGDIKDVVKGSTLALTAKLTKDDGTVVSTDVTYTATSSDAKIATVADPISGATITINGVDVGDVTITIESSYKVDSVVKTNKITVKLTVKAAA